MRKLFWLTVFFAACTDSTNISIEISQALDASDELTGTNTGVCSVLPIIQAGGIYKSSGSLELDPQLNPFPSYELNVQVENYLDITGLQGADGTQIVGANYNDFHAEQAIIKYIDIEGQLTGPAQDKVLVSGVVRAGGLQGATAVPIKNAIGPSEVTAWVNSFETGNLLTEDVVLEIQILGVLSSGEQAATGLFHFPVQLCFGCGGLPLTANASDAGATTYPPFCPTGSTPVPIGHGPCCAAQDFYDVCESCGEIGQPCCVSSPGGLGTCNGSATCSGMVSATTGELCPFNYQISATCAAAH